MFKYLWIIFFLVIFLALGISTVLNIIEAFKENYDYYIIHDNGNWIDVLDINFYLKDSSILFIALLILIILVGSFGAFVAYFT